MCKNSEMEDLLYTGWSFCRRRIVHVVELLVLRGRKFRISPNYNCSEHKFKIVVKFIGTKACCWKISSDKFTVSGLEMSNDKST